MRNPFPVRNFLFRAIPGFLLCICMDSALAQSITIDNNKPKKDPSGSIIDVHDGNMLKSGELFYWYGTAYGNTNGFTYNNYFQCYSSRDLMHWSGGGSLLSQAPKGIYYRPHVIYNKLTRLYVLWYNWYPAFWDGKFGVAVSKSPAGPFKIVSTDVKVLNSDKGLGDLNLFVDEDGEAYLIYNSIAGHFVSVEKLKNDYLSSTLENSGILAKDCEAETMFKRNGKYYLLTDQACCFCNYGTGARVFIAGSPLGKFEERGNINRYPGRMNSGLIDNIKNGNVFETLSRDSTRFDQVEINLPAKQSFQDISVYVFTGNRPENCGDVNIPKVHPDFIDPAFDFYLAEGSVWKKAEPVKRRVDTTAIQRIMTFRFAAGIADKIRVAPKPDYPYTNIYIAEIEVLQQGKNVAFVGNGTKAYVLGAEKPMAIVPAQQTYVMPLETEKGTDYIWMGDLWGSAPDNNKAHDNQYWTPLEFDEAGNILPMKWVDSWNCTLKK